MRPNLLTAAAAAALLISPAAFAQGSSQADVPGAKHQNSAHANAPNGPDEMNPGETSSGARTGGMQNTSADQNRGGDMDSNGGNMGSDRDRMGNGQNDRDRMRTNEAGERAHLRLTTTQRTRIRDVIVRAHGPRLTRVNFRVGVGARIPRTIRIAVLPPEIVAIAPEWQGYSYFEYGDQIVVVDPATFAIVATLPL